MIWAAAHCWHSSLPKGPRICASLPLCRLLHQRSAALQPAKSAWPPWIYSLGWCPGGPATGGGLASAHHSLAVWDAQGRGIPPAPCMYSIGFEYVLQFKLPFSTADPTLCTKTGARFCTFLPACYSKCAGKLQLGRRAGARRRPPLSSLRLQLGLADDDPVPLEPLSHSPLIARLTDLESGPGSADLCEPQPRSARIAPPCLLR